MNRIEFLDLGKQPIANRFVYANEVGDEYFYHLRVGMDSDTKLITHMEYVDSPMMFNENYAYRGSMSRTMVNHFADFSNTIKAAISPKNVLEIGSNDGVFLKNWSSGTTYAVEPCSNFAKETNDLGYKTYHSFWNVALSEQIKKEHGTMDMVFAANCMCHIPNLDDAFEAVYNILSPGGRFIFEDPSLAQMLNSNSYDQIYDEHPHIFSVIALNNILARHKMQIVRVDNISVHGGSNRIYAARIEDNVKVESSVQDNITFETIMGCDSLIELGQFARRVLQSSNDLYALLAKCKNAGKKVISYGATSKSTTVFNYSGIDPELISYVIDITPEKIGKLTPGSHIPIVNEPRIPNDVDYAFLGAWNFAAEISKKESEFIQRGGKFITHVPIVKFI